MPYAQYNIDTGSIAATCSNKVNDSDLASLNRGQVEVDPSVTGATHIIDLQSLLPVELPPALPDAPDLITQITAILIADGLDSSRLELNDAQKNAINDQLAVAAVKIAV